MDELFDPVTLLSKPLTRPAHTRNYIGDVAARFAEATLGFKLLPIKQNVEICPDFQMSTLHGEIKSVGKNRRALLYKWRAEKEARHFDPRLYLYLFVQHVCPITCSDISQITAHFRDNPVTLYGCTLAELQETVAAIPVRKFSLFKESPDPRIGYNRAGYIEGGWQFGMKILPAPVMTHTIVAGWMEQVKPVAFQMSEGWVKAQLQAAFDLKTISTHE